MHGDALPVPMCSPGVFNRVTHEPFTEGSGA
jgi:hypothetical protein